MGKNFERCEYWKKRGNWMIVVLLTALFIAIQSGRLTVPPWDTCESWRQTDTYSIARNYVYFGMDFLRPQLNYDGVADNYAQLELQIVPFLSALIFKLTGVMAPMVCRTLSLVFFLGSAGFLYFLLQDLVGRMAALVGYGVYLFLPLSLLMASSIQPESCALFFYCGGVYLLRRYERTRKYSFLTGAAAMTAVAIMEKTPVVFVGLLFLYVLLSVMGKGFYKNPWFYSCGAIALLPPVALIAYTSQHSKFCFVDGIASKHIFTKEIFALFTKEGVTFFSRAFTTYFGWAVIVLCVLGMLLLVREEYRFALVWTVAFALECATVVAVIKFNYYLVFILPVCAMLVSLAVKDLAEHRKSVAAVACAFTILSLYLKGTNAWERTKEVEEIGQVGHFIAENTDFDEGIAVGVVNPAYINAADRRGYRANIKYYDYIPTEPDDELAYFADHGVRWLVVRGGYIDGDSDGSYLAYVRENYPVYAADESCVIYDLKAKGDG